ncbi:MAG TPA: prolyl oligopeptidase family serine peptidase [Bryobacteraceae bacterium]|nr:prolyl oligopeptidase family serine peptidase [Bryobacteraceae bacterium]
MQAALFAQQPGTLPGTAHWEFPPDIVSEQHFELRRYFEARIAAAASQRGSSAEGTQTVEELRSDFRRMIGAVDPFLPPKPVLKQIGATAAFTFSLVEWPVLPLGNVGSTAGSSGGVVKQYGLLLESKRSGKHPAAIAIPDAHLSAADIAGLTTRLPQREQYARSLAVNGYVVLVPFFTQRRTFSQPWLDDRAWLVRLGYQVGRHLIGSEVQQVSSAVDFLGQLPRVDRERIGVAGSGQGGLTALYAAALDTRLKAALVANYFDRRDRAFEEPEDRILWKHLQRFGDAEIASFIAPRALVIDRGGRGVVEEYQRARRLFERANAAAAIRYSGERDQQHGPATAAIELFDEVLHPDVQWPISAPQAPPDPEPFYAIANAQFSQWQARYRNLAMEAYGERDRRWRPDTSSAANYRNSSKPLRELFLDTVGRYAAPSGALDARSVKLYDEPEFTGYRLSVRVYDGVHAYGILLIPKHIQAGERRPVVFTQHGFGDKPEDALGVVDNQRADSLYAKFGRQLARRGYIVFAPLISAQTTSARQALARRAHLLGLTPVGIEIKKAGRVLDYLETLPFADKERFAFYGLSYGGFTALWTGPAEPRFQAVICSGHFNDWNFKTTDLTEGTSFLFYKDTFDMFNFDILHKFNHSDLARLTAPRAFMIEIGSRDGVEVEPRRFVDVEMARVTRLYRELGIPQKGRIARFDGPHRIDGAEAIPFLDEMLNWKPRH